MRQLLVLAAFCATCAACGAQELGQADPEVQRKIQKVFKAFQQRVDPRENVEAFGEIQSLKALVDNRAEIVKQVAIFAADPAGNESQPIAANMLLQMLDLPPETVIPVLAPYLDDENPRLRSFTQDWFQAHDNGGSDETPLTPVNFEDYAEYVREAVRRNEEVSDPFVDYIYDRSPERALLVFSRANAQRPVAAQILEERAKVESAQRELQDLRKGANNQPPRRLGQQRGDEKGREVILAERIVSNALRLKGFDQEFQKALPEAKEQLAKLSGNSEWWVRLYVAEIMRRNRELRMDDVVEKLRTDEHALVSKAARSISN